MDTHSAVKISLSFILLAAVVQFDPVNVSNTFEIIKAKIMNVSRKDIESCIKSITSSINEDLKHEGWKRVEAAKDSRVWKYDEEWLSREILDNESRHVGLCHIFGCKRRKYYLIIVS